MRDYRQELADRLGLEVDRLHFDVKRGASTKFEILVDGQDLTVEQERTAIAFIEANPDVATLPKKSPASFVAIPPCHSCASSAVGGVRISNTLRTYYFCASHADPVLAEAARVDRIINKPCSKCGAPAPYYHHLPDCERMKIRQGLK